MFSASVRNNTELFRGGGAKQRETPAWVLSREDNVDNDSSNHGNCDEVVRQGGMQFQGDYYIMIKPDGITRPFRVLCQTLNNSGWTVIQKRKDGSVDFFRNWQEYKKGFGNLEGEFWLGNDYIHHLSVQEPTMLRIEMIDWDDKTYTALYDTFTIENEKNLYRLHIGSYHGDAGDSLKSHWENHDGMPFSTKDRDNDGRYYDSCAEHFHGAWWFNNCFDSHLNGKYYHKGFHKNYFQRDGIQWNTIHMYSSLKGRADDGQARSGPAACLHSASW
ncbi:hypothetical protein C0Q70_08231 [Pomacea canaliculata]|uniref:Fibrinogen C-terminal domain-containing protein n=1 Tax=Pomacea canaliculata TaxID=400727 RepID=A0A2T7PH85_POMCA|nr:hypothetical protein C0Q70_08231 [Pomacea canaliculata]